MCKSSHHPQLNILSYHWLCKPRGAPWLVLGSLLVLMLLLSGCTIQPVNAGEPPEMPVPLGDEQVIAIAPNSAASGTTVAVAGAGWQPNEVVYVNLEGVLDGVPVENTLVMTSTDSAGRFVTEFVAPLDIFWQGATDVQVAAYSLDKARSASTPFSFRAATATAPSPMTPTFTPLPPTPLPPTVGPATATPRPPSPPPTAVQPDGTARVISAGLNMRSGPGTNFPVLRTLTNGALLVVLGQNYSGQWLYVQTSDLQLGWVARNYTNFFGSAPIITTPPTPVPPATWTPTPTAWPTFVPPPGQGWQGDYFTNRFLAGFPTLVRQDGAVDFNWGYGSPAPSIPVDNFSVRWSSAPWFDSGAYRFLARADDGVRIWVDGNLLIDQWHNWRNETYAAEIWLGAGYHTVVVDYYEETGLAFITAWWERINPDYFPEWKGEYFSNRRLEGSPAYVRNDSDIDFNWGTSSPAPGIPSTNFSVRWTRRIDFSSGVYHLRARADDGVRVWVDGNRVIDAWFDSDYGPTHVAEIYLSGHHDIRVEYYQHLGGARVRFWWERISRGTSTPTRTPTATATLTAAPTNTVAPTSTPTVTPTPTATRPAPVNPYADVNPSSGPAGTNVNISFGNFPANTKVNLYLGGYANAASAEAANAVVYATNSSDRFGRGSLSFTIPAAWPDGAPIDPGRLALLLATPGFSVTATTDFMLVRAQPTVAANPYANANPSSGGAGTVVTVNGGGFPVNTTLNVYLGGVVRASELAAAAPVATTLSDANGNFTANVTVPATWPDGQAIPSSKLVILVATPNFSVEASANFDFFTVAPNPAVSLNPAGGAAGTLVTVSGVGYPANVNVGVFLAALDASVGGGATQSYATGRTDRDGNVSLSFVMPATWPDGSPIMQNQVVVTLARLDFSVSASAVFTFVSPGPTWTPTPSPTVTTTPVATATALPAPEISISPTSGTAGTVVTVTGSGFAANSTLYAHLALLGGSGGSGNEYANYAVVTANAVGAFNLTITMPAVWPNGTPIPSGRLVIQVANADFSHQASASFDYRSLAGAVEEATATPTQEPTATATEEPVVEPVVEPTVEPTVEPVVEPTEEPVVEPTATPAEEQAAINTPAVVATRTATPVPTEEDTPEPTLMIPADPPTATPRPTEEATPEPTAEPPTATPLPTEEPPPATSRPSKAPPTATSKPPTSTPAPTATATWTPLPPAVEPPTATPVELPSEPPVVIEPIEEPTAVSEPGAALGTPYMCEYDPTPPDPKCTIKGDSANGLTYYLPGHRDYCSIEIDESAGDRWFCSVEQAENAGWQLARR